MSDIVKLNIKSKGIKAVLSDQLGKSDGFIEMPAVIEREKQEHAHKLELENEYARGFEEGKQDATVQLEEKHSKELLAQSQDFYKIISTFEESIKIFEHDFSQMVINLAERIASKVVKKEMEINSTIKQVLDDNLRRIIGANDIVIKLNPKDVELLEKGSLHNMNSAGIEKIRFESNNSVGIGGCLIESEIGNLDARVESQINELVKVLENSLTINSSNE